MLFSIIIPCYNCEAYLQKLFNCLKGQTYGMDKLEIICVDDGSTDGTFKHLQAYSESYSNVHVITQANAGVSAARNAGMQAATGEWIVFLDSDDWVSPNYFTELAAAITKYPNVLVHFTACATHHESNGREKLMRNSAPKTVVATDKEGVQLFDLDDHNELFRVIWRMAFNTGLLRRYDLKFDTGIRFGEDTLFHFEYLACIRDYVEQQEKLQAQTAEIAEGGANPAPAEAEPATTGALPTNPVRLASYLPKAIYFYFKVTQVRGRAHDMHQKDLIQAGYIFNERHFDLGRRRGFDANFLNEMFKHVGFSVVFALSFSKNLTNYTHERRQDIVRYLKSLRDWMVIFRDLGLTHKFLEVVSKQEFYVRSRAIPQSLYLQAVACNPHRINQSIAHFQVEEPSAAPVSTKEEARVVSESVIANFTRRLKKSFIKFFTGKERETVSPEKAAVTGQSTTRAFDISTINNLPVNHANEVDFLYYDTIYYGDQAYLSILTNATHRLEAKLDEIKFNKKNITRSAPYRVYGIQLGQQILINLSLLSSQETKQLLGFCADLRKHNLFDYEERALVKFFGKLLKGVSTKTKNFVVYDEQGTKLDTMQQLLSHLGPQGNHHGSKLINSFELGYPVNLEQYSLAQREARLAAQRAAEAEAARQAELERQVQLEMESQQAGQEAHAASAEAPQASEVATPVEATTPASDATPAQVATAPTQEETSAPAPEQAPAPEATTPAPSASVSVDSPNAQAVDVEVTHQADAPILATTDALDACEGAVAQGVKFSDIFAAFRIRGFTPSEYDLIYRPMSVDRLVDNRSLGGAMNFYMDYGRANSLALPLSLLLDRQFAAEKLFTRRAPLYDCLVVVDCEVSEFVFESLALLPNLRLLFPDVETYNSWLEALAHKSASPAELSQHQVNATLYQKYYEQWQLLRRAFVLVAA